MHVQVLQFEEVILEAYPVPQNKNQHGKILQEVMTISRHD